MELPDKEVCPLGYVIGPNGITIPWDSAFEKGDLSSIKGSAIGINIRTLIRNAMNSYDKDPDGQPHLVERVEEDILNIKEYFSNVHDSTVTIYSVPYKRQRIAKLPNFKVPKTPKQIMDNKMVESAISRLQPSIDKSYSSSIRDFEFIVSHIIYDMVMAGSSTKLLETHTGAIKNRDALNSKLNLTDGEYMVVPFNSLTYMLYGDKVLLNKNTKVTNKLMDILIDGRVTPLSTESRTDMVIKLRDPVLHKFMKEIIR